MNNKNSTGVGGEYTGPQMEGGIPAYSTGEWETKMKGTIRFVEPELSQLDFMKEVLSILSQQLSLNKRNTMYTGIGAAVAVCAFVAWLFWG